jgi:hypothetical protein
MKCREYGQHVRDGRGQTPECQFRAAGSSLNKESATPEFTSVAILHHAVATVPTYEKGACLRSLHRCVTERRRLESWPRPRLETRADGQQRWGVDR